MEIEAGKYYRMRCGGAINIILDDGREFYNMVDKYGNGWWDDGLWSKDEIHPFDLVAEITEAEYNRIVSGEAYESAVLDTAETKMMEMHKEIEALKKERDEWKSCFEDERKEWRDAMNNQRRFESAKAAMQGILASHENWFMDDNLSKYSVKVADALLKALEETK